MVQQGPTAQRRRSLAAARRQALARLKKGLDLRWTPDDSREAVHDSPIQRSWKGLTSLDGVDRG